MKKQQLNQVKRKEAQSLARNMNKVYQGFIAGQRKLPFFKRQKLALSIAYGVPMKFKILRISAGFGILAGKLQKFQNGRKSGAPKVVGIRSGSREPAEATAAAEV